MNNLSASNQWATRPADERFPTLEAARAAAFAAFERSTTINAVPFRQTRVLAQDDLYLYDEGHETRHRLSYASARNLASQVKAPHRYLTTLGLDLAAKNYNYGIQQADAEKVVDLYTMDEKNSASFLLRDITSPKYKRIYHHEVIDKVIALRDQFSLRTPPARSPQQDPMEVAKMGGTLIPTRIATVEDVIASMHGGIQVKVGDVIADAGIYYGQGAPEVFIFQVSDKQIQDGTDQGLFRGFIISTSETMGTSYQVDYFLFRGICGNHIIWGMKDLASIRVKHVGTARDRAFEAIEEKVQSFLDASPQVEEEKIERAKVKLVADTSELMIDVLYTKGIASQKQLIAAYAATTVLDSELNPLSYWGMAQGLTRISQVSAFADDRMAIDKAAGKLLALAGN